MATEKYEVLVKIGIDSKVVQDSIANADRLTAEITKLREAQKASGVQDAETTAAIKALTQERSRDLRVVQQANTLASETVKGQERLKAELSLLTVQYNNLTTAEQASTESGQKMGARIRALSDELKANESAVGNNTRNVGNYTNSIKTALVSISGAVPGLKGLKKGLDGATTGFKAAGGGVKGLSAAFMTLGIPLIVAAVSSLIANFDTLKASGGLVGNVITAIGNTVKMVTDKIKAFSDFLGLTDFKADKINENQKKRAEELTDVIKAQEDANVALIKNAEERKIAERKLALKRQLEEIKTSGAEETKLKVDLEKVAANDIENIRKEESDKRKAESDKANEERQKEFEKKQAIDAKEKEAAKKQADDLRKIAEDFMREQMDDTDRQLLDIGKRANAARAAGIKEVDITTFINEEVKKIEDAARAEKIAKDSEAFTKQIELLGLQEQVEIQAAENSIKNETDLATKKGEIALGYLAQKLAIMEQLAMVDKEKTAEEKANIDLIKGAIAGLQNQLANPEEKPKTIGDMLGLSDEEIEKTLTHLDNVSQILSGIDQATKAIFEAKIAQIDAQSNAEIEAINNSTLSEEQKAARIKTIEQKAARDKYKLEVEQFKIAQALQIAMAIANTATAVMAQISNPTPYAGFVLAALAGVTGAAQIALIASQQPPPPPAFASGGFVSGAGSGTSDSIPAMLSNGESVNNAETTRRFAPLLSSLNAAGGGVDWYRGEGFASGGLVRKFATGGVAMSSSSMIRENQQVAMMAAQMSMSQPVLVIEEFQSVQGRQVRTEQNLQL
jgi:hypothetical protein